MSSKDLEHQHACPVARARMIVSWTLMGGTGTAINVTQMIDPGLELEGCFRIFNAWS